MCGIGLNRRLIDKNMTKLHPIQILATTTLISSMAALTATVGTTLEFLENPSLLRAAAALVIAFATGSLVILTVLLCREAQYERRGR